MSSRPSVNVDVVRDLLEFEPHLADGREFADVRARITEAENRQTKPDSTDATPRVEDEETGAQTSQTPLERICALPKHVADRELTANQAPELIQFRAVLNRPPTS